MQDVIRDRLPEPARRERFVAAAGLCDAPSRADDAGAAAWAAHLVVLAEHGEQLGLVPDRLVESLSALARRYAARALYPAATQVLDAALRLVRVPAHGAPAADRAVQEGRLLCQLGEVLRRGRPAARGAAAAPGRGAHAAALVGPDDVALAHAHNRLGHVLNCADDIEGAIADAPARAGRAGPRPDATTCARRCSPTWDTRCGRPAGSSRPSAALRAARAALAAQGRRDDRDWAHATAGLGMVEQDSGQLAAAVGHQRTVIEVFTRVCGADHPDTAQALDKLGYVLRLQGELAESVASGERAVRLLERVLGPDDSRVGMALTNLGLAYADADQPERAVQSQTRARAIFLAQLGPTHAHTLLAGRRLAVALARTDHPLRARALVEEVLADRRAPAGTTTTPSTGGSRPTPPRVRRDRRRRAGRSLARAGPRDAQRRTGRRSSGGPRPGRAPPLTVAPGVSRGGSRAGS